MDPINIEVMLLNWSETANGGAKIVLQLADTADLERFKAMTLAKGKRAGQRLACAFVEIGDDEKPVQHRRRGAGPLAQLAGRWCEDEGFQTWLPIGHSAVCVRLDALGGVPGSRTDYAAAVVRQVCGVESRAELDTDPNAGRSFHKLIREPFQAWLAPGERGTSLKEGR